MHATPVLVVSRKGKEKTEVVVEMNQAIKSGI